MVSGRQRYDVTIWDPLSRLTFVSVTSPWLRSTLVSLFVSFFTNASMFFSHSARELAISPIPKWFSGGGPGWRKRKLMFCQSTHAHSA